MTRSTNLRQTLTGLGLAAMVVLLVIGGCPGDPLAQSTDASGSEPGDRETRVEGTGEIVLPPMEFDVDRYFGSPPLSVVAEVYTLNGEALPEGTYRWNFAGVEDAGPVATHAQRGYTFRSAGTYTISLTLTVAGITQVIGCAQGNDSPDPQPAQVVAMPVQPPAFAPQAMAGPDQTLFDSDGNQIEPVTLDGGGSSDADGSIVDYRWSTDGMILYQGPQPVTSVQLGVGMHVITLTVTDNDGRSDSDTVVVVVSGGQDGECLTAEESWQGASFNPVTGRVQVKFSLTTFSERIDGIVGVGSSEIEAESDTAAAIRLTPTGFFQAIDGDGYAATSDVPYEAAKTYDVTMAIDLDSHVYDVVIEFSDGSETTLALGYAFRDTQSAISSLAAWAARATDGAFEVCDMEVALAPNEPPVADAGPDFTVQDTNGDGSAAVTLDGSGSFDPDGTIVNYQWLLGAAVIASGSNPTTALDLPVGSHSILLRVTDDRGAQDSDWVGVTVRAADPVPPVANAGPDQSVTDSDDNGSEAVTLNGSGSSDADGSIVNYRWVDDDATVLYDGASATVSVTLGVGTHDITLTVRDNDGQSDTDTVRVVVNAAPLVPPVADAGDNQTVVDTDRGGDESVTLDGSGSSDADGTIVNYRWVDDDATVLYNGPSATRGVTLALGVHDITLTVTDNDGLTDTDTVRIAIIEPANVPPTAHAGSDQTVTDSDDNGSESVTLDGSGSSDADGSITNYRWVDDDATVLYNGANATAGVTLAVGTHDITLTVTDNDGATDSDTVRIVVNAAPLVPPVADAGSNITVTDSDDNGSETVTLDGSGSSDADGTIVNYRWTDGATPLYDGPSATTSAALTVGVHSVFLTVTDNDGLTDTVRIYVIVNPFVPDPEPPVADAGSDQVVVDTDRNGSETVTLDGSGSSDADGSIVAYKWVDDDDTVLYNGPSATASVTLAVGTHDITLTVTDNDGLSDTDLVQVDVQQGPVANAGSNQTVVDVNYSGGEVVTLNGSGSSDADGSIVNYRWVDDDATVLYNGPSATRAVTLGIGVHDITLTVTDDDGHTATDTVRIVVEQGPVANAGSDDTVLDANHSGDEAVTLNGSGSSDADGSIVNYRWVDDDATVLYNGPSATRSVTLDLGVHDITLTVTDDDGHTATDTVRIVVEQGPVANAGSDQTVTDSDDNGSEAVTLNGSGSSDADGTIVNYTWREGANPALYSGASATTSVTLAVGVHDITLTVTDDDGHTATDVVRVTVQAPAQVAPVADAGEDRTVADADGSGGEVVTLDGSGSSDADGTIVNYRWVDDDDTVLYTGANATADVTLGVATHTITLTVTDNDGQTGSDTVVITVDAQMASSLTQYGITWTFDQPYPVGQFVSGDWWVTPLTPGGTVTVVNVDPAPTTIPWRSGTADVHGSMVNPAFNQSPYSTRQGFDSRAGSYRVVGDSPGDTGHVYRVGYPLTLSGSDQLISTESWLVDEDHEDILGVTPGIDHACLKSAAILTCLDTPPSATAFRPAYMDPTNTVYDYADVDWDKLPNLAPPSDMLRYPHDGAVSGNPADQPCTVYARFFERPWLLGWQYGVHPTEHHPWYYEPCQAVAADAAALLLCDYADREALLIPYLQFCIDTYHATLGDADYQNEQRGDRSLMKWPCLFAGELLGVPEMKAVGYVFKTESDTYYRNDAESSLTSQTIPADEFWVVTRGHWSPPPGGQVVGWRADPGDNEHEHLDPLTSLPITDVYYDGASYDGRLEVSDDGHSAYLRTYNSDETLLAEVHLHWRASVDEQGLGWIRFDEFDTLVALINDQPGWHAAATAYPDAEGPFCRGPHDETTCKGAGNAVTIQCREWDLVPNLGGRKKETYRGINSYPWPGFALAAHSMNLVQDWAHAPFFDYVDRWMTEDGAGESADLDAAGLSPLAVSKSPGQASSDFVEALWAAYR
jgi:hypothetical protein